MSIPKKIHRVWLGGPMPEEFVRYGEAWQEMHPDWEVKTWSEDDLQWLQNRSEFEDAEFLSSKSNIARYEIVLREGGLYVDCDFEPLRPFDELLEGADLVVGEQTPGVLNNALFAAKPGHPVLQYAVQQLPESHAGRAGAISPQRTGPNFWTRCVRRSCAHLNLAPRVLSREQVSPYSWTQDDPGPLGFPQAYAVHHWAKSWHQPDARRRGTRRLRPRLRQGASSLKRSVNRIRGRWKSLEPQRTRHSAIYVGEGRLLVTTARRFSVLAQAGDLGVTPSLVAEGLYDKGFAEFLRRELHEGDVTVDVGANIGLFTLEMARAVGSTGRVFAYEPHPAIFDLLKDSVHMNRMRGLRAEVAVRQLAVGAAPGTATLHSPERHPGMGSLNPHGVPVDMPKESHEVQITTLDVDLAAIPEIRLVKIDVEGGELSVLRGMSRLLDEGRVRLIDLELLDMRAGPTWNALADELRSMESRWNPTTFTITSDGNRRPISLQEAIHTDGLQHLCFEISRPSFVPESSSS